MYTNWVVTMWYRAPELLLGGDIYNESIDMWSVACIFSELILREPLFTGKNEMDQIDKIFNVLGNPTEESWPGFSTLKLVNKVLTPSTVPSPCNSTVPCNGLSLL